MSRWYDEDIWVSTIRRRLDEDPAGESPERFVWRGRLYVVTEVQASWRERQPWWVLCEDAFSPVPGDGSPAPLGDRVVELLARSSVRRCWRVRARSGALGVAGTYEMVRATAPAATGGRGSAGEQIVGARSHSGITSGGGPEAAQVAWRLMRVGD